MDVRKTMAVNPFQKNGYTTIKKAIPKDVANFVYNYFRLKREVFITFKEDNYISPYNDDWGTFQDSQALGSYSHYGDIAMETLLLMVQPKLEKEIKKNVLPTYAYARIYKEGSELKKHTDRFSCEISCTMHLGGDGKWPIYLKHNNKNVPINLDAGDLLIYSGEKLQHWREPYLGKEYAQVFLHYNDATKEKSKKNIFDTRKHLGLPTSYKK